MNADRAVGVGEQTLPLLHSVEYERHEFGPLELAPSWVNPDHWLILFRAQEDHVVIRRDHDLVRLPGVGKDDIVTRAPSRRLVTLVSDVARLDPQLS